MNADAVVFLDAETTRLDRRRRPWEIAIIRRDGAGEKAITIYIDIVDLDLDNADPESLQLAAFRQRHPAFGRHLDTGQRLCRAADAARLVHAWTAGARVFGVVPSFDTFCLGELLHRHGLEPQWHFQPWDIAVYASGYLTGRRQRAGSSSEAVSLQCGVAPPTGEERHTAMGDARWVQRWYDRLAVGPQSSAAAAA